MSPADSRKRGRKDVAPGARRDQIAARLKSALSSGRVTYDEAASVGQVARSTIQRMVGGGSMDLEVVARIASHLGLSLDALVFGKTKSENDSLPERDVYDAAAFILSAAPSFEKASPSGKISSTDLAQLIVDRARHLRSVRTTLTNDEKY